VFHVLTPFMLVVLGALISSFLMPRFFENEILVWPQKLSGFFVLTPLAPNSGNYTQDMYLLVNAVLAVTASFYVTLNGFDLRRLLNAYFVASLSVVFIALWEFAGNTFHVWFPATFFLSNPGWSLLNNQTFGSLIRLNGPFSEPSSLAGYLSASTAAAGWLLLNGDKTLMPRIVFVASLMVTLLSTSTTGYVTLAGLAALLFIYTIIAGTPALRKRLAMGFAGVIAVIGACIVIVPAVAPGVATETITIVNGTLNKQSSSSYQDRTSTDSDSMNELVESYGLGVGWGSNRSSSLIPGLSAAVGAWGLLGLLWFIARIVRHVRAAQQLATQAQSEVMHACVGSLLGTLISAVISGPSISSPDFYLILALLIGTAARARFEARAESFARSPVPAFGRRPGYEPSGLSKG
jgi:hypothetical protein